MVADQDLDVTLREPEFAKFRVLFEYWKSKRNGDGKVPRAGIDPIEIPSLLPNIFLVDVVGEGVTRYRFRLVGTKICDLEGNITGKYLDELDAEQEHIVMSKHYADACDDLLYIRDTNLGWMGKEFRHYRVMLLPLHGSEQNVDMLIGLADYLPEVDSNGDDEVHGSPVALTL